MAEPKIIYEDKNFLAVDKPCGMQVHKADSSDTEFTLADWLIGRYPYLENVGDEPSLRPGIVHRLDKLTSGVMVVAKNQEYFRYLKSLFQGRQVKKIYIAVVYGEVKTKEGMIDSPIGIKSGSVKRSVHSEKMVKEAVTHYKVRKIMETGSGVKFSLMELMPLTGRTHQIRVHLASIGHPVVGDPLYGKRKGEIPGIYPRMMLHSLSIEFPATQGRRIKIESEPPGDFKFFMKNLGDDLASKREGIS